MSLLFAAETDPRVTELRRRLDQFYAAPVKYTDFEHDMQMLPDFWPAVVDEVRARVARSPGGGPIRFLEFGAGKTGFGTFAGDLRKSIRFEVQDITERNRAYLEGQADQVHICDLSQLKGPYDVMLSTFAYEHMSNPRQTLEHLLTMLAPGGTMFIAAPRYSMPLYIPPSARHYPLGKQLSISAWLAWQRIMARIDRKPRFWIHVDPAVFNVPWYRDADAVHWVSLLDFKLAMPAGYRVSRVRLKVNGWKRKVWENFLLAYVRIDRDR